MPSYLTTKGKVRVARSGWDAGDYRVVVVDTPPASQAAAEDLNFVSEIAVDEVVGATRKVLANKAVNENDTDNRAELDADDPSEYTGLDGPTMAGVYVIFQVTNDADSEVIGFLDHNDVVTNGGGVTVSLAATGAFHLT